MKKIFLLIWILLSLNSYSQISPNWKIASSIVTFKIKNAGFTVDGNFGAASGSVIFDKEQLSGNKIEASINSNTIKTGINARDKHLKKEEFFSVEKFPKIIAKSVSVTKQKNGSYIGVFALTIKGVTKTISIPFSFIENGNTSKLAATFTINRLDYNVGESSFMMADKVAITIELNLTK